MEKLKSGGGDVAADTGQENPTGRKPLSKAKVDDKATGMKNNNKCVCIVLLGDIGRSPRMRYHATSLAHQGYVVHFIGYGGSLLPDDLAKNPSIWVDLMREPPSLLQKIPRMLAYPLKVAWQMLILSWAFVWMLLRYQFYPDFILLQNPPAIPTLTVCWLFSIVLWADFIVDWHNYGFSLMGITLGDNNPVVKMSKWIEDYFGAKADKHICVTRAMKDDLKARLGVDAVTLYDRPPDFFKPLSDAEKITFLKKFSSQYSSLLDVIDNISDLRKRPGILLSSTSWTEDENFNILLSALEEYESASQENPKLFSKLIVFITGKGPQKEYFRGLINNLEFKNVEINLPWLEHEDYPKLLACADLGISLHFSSSGLDLPMKVVDMFGCGLPVCAANFKCISELVKHNENSLVFEDATELAQQIQDWFKITSKPNPKHNTFRENLKAFQTIRWHENWKFNAQPLFT